MHLTLHILSMMGEQAEELLSPTFSLTMINRLARIATRRLLNVIVTRATAARKPSMLALSRNGLWLKEPMTAATGIYMTSCVAWRQQLTMQLFLQILLVPKLPL